MAQPADDRPSGHLPRLAAAAGLLLLFGGIYVQCTLRPPTAVATAGDDARVEPPGFLNRIPVPPLARVTVESDRDHYFLGENPLLHLNVENRGRLPFSISTGGDYRGSTRPDRFHITARDAASGQTVADPMPEQFNMGGMGSKDVLQPGEKFTASTALMRHALIERPGVYRITISHDFGWYSTPTRPIPTAQLTLRFSEPDAATARDIVAKADSPHGLVGNTRAAEFGDHTSLRHPLYLPLLQTRAASGSVAAVNGIGHIKGTPATAALITLAADPESTADIRLAAFKMLSARAIPTRHHFAGLVISPKLISADAWNDELHARALHLARAFLATDEALTSDATPHAVDLIRVFGNADDAPRLLAITEANLFDSSPGGGIPHLQSQRIFIPLNALRALHLKGWPAPTQPANAAELYLIFDLIKHEQLPHSPEIEQLALTHLSHPCLIVRRAAYDTILQTVPATALAQVRADFQTPALVSTVLSLITRTNDTRLSPDLLTRLETNQDRHRHRQLVSHALRLTGPHEVIPRLIARLNEPALAREALDQLTSLVIDRQPSNFRTVTWTQSELDALQTAWRDFYALRKERIINGEKFSANSARVPAALFGGRYDWSPRPMP